MSSNLPALSSDSGLRQYLEEIRKFPVLEPEEEYMLAKRLREHGDMEAAHRLVTSHLRLVAKIAMKYRGYGLPLSDLIAEGNIGMMQAVKKFEPERGFRLATYAMWWIKASIQEYVLRSWSLVKIGTSATQKRLFFNLRRMKNRIGAYQDGDLTPEQLQEIARELEVSEADVTDMNRLMSSSMRSLDAPIASTDGDSTLLDLLPSNDEAHDESLANLEEQQNRSRQLAVAMASLNERERDIFTQRRLQDEPQTLEELSAKYSISRERVRQIEAAVFEKLRKLMMPALPKAQQRLGND
jgi:RNA polymerase sigma-32 factor